MVLVEESQGRTNKGGTNYAPFRFISSVKQSSAGAAISSIQFTMFISAGVLILVSSVAVNAIGFGPFFTILAGFQAIAASNALIIVMRKRKELQ